MENQNDNQKEIEDRLKQFLHRYYDNQEKHEKAPNFPENTKEFIDRNKEIFDLEVDLKNFSPIKIRSNEKDNNIDILSSNDRNDHINKEEFNKKNINTPKKIEETLNVSIYNDSKLKNTKNNTENYEKSTDIPKINNEIQKKSQDIFGKILVNPYQLVKVDKKKQKITKNNTSFSKKNNNNKNSLSKSPKPTQNKSRSNQKPKLLNKSGEKAKKAVFFANQTMKNHNNLSSCKMNTNKLEEIKKSPRRENGKREIKEFERIKSMESYNNKKKNSKNSVKQNIMFKETFERIDNLNNSGIFLADFKKEVNQLIILIKKEKKVILDDITALNNQAKKYKANYLQLKKRIEVEKTQKQISCYDKETNTISEPKKTSFIDQAKTRVSERIQLRNGSIQSKKQDINENLKNYRKISHKDIQTSLFSEIDKKNVEELQSENRNYMKKKQSQIEYEEYDIYESSDKIDEEKIKKIGNLLTTMNMDNTESDYSIINTLHTLDKDDFIELQHMIIQKLIDNFAIEKNEKEMIELQTVNQEKEFIETKNLLEEKIKIFEMSAKQI